MATMASVYQQFDVPIRGDRYQAAMQALNRAADMAYGRVQLPNLRPDVLECYPMVYVGQAIDEAIELLSMKE